MDFYTLSKITMVISLFEPLLICAVCWPSARNLLLIQLLPFTLLPLVGGVFYYFEFRVGNLGGNDPYLASLLITLLIGATTHAIAFFLAFRLQNSIKATVSVVVEKIKTAGTRAPPRLIGFVTILAGVSAVLQLGAYAKMGFAPMFAADPLAAKFYAGSYADDYGPVAPFLRFGFQMYVAAAPLFMVCIPRNFSKKIGYGLIIAIAAIAVLLSLKRGPIASPFLVFFLAWAVFYRNGKFAKLALLSNLAIYALGAASIGIVLYVAGVTQDLDPAVVFSGVPDISDLLWFWSGFQTRDYDFSLGRTVLGGLIPFHYDWNPAVVTKLAIGASADAPTGGFRLPDAVWGYIAYGYVGAVAWPAFSGAMAGMQTSLLKGITERKDLTFFQFYMMYFVLTSIMSFLGGLLTFGLDLVTAAFFAYVLVIVIIGRPQRPAVASSTPGLSLSSSPPKG
jgi:hypothetical protein